MKDWSKPTSSAEAASRAGGRRHYNSTRAARATRRRMEAITLITAGGLGLMDWGSQTKLAETLGVSRSTVSRDIKRLLEASQPCPHCGKLENLIS